MPQRIINHVKKKKEHYLLGTLLLTIGAAIYVSTYFFSGASAYVAGDQYDPCTDQAANGNIELDHTEAGAGYSTNEAGVIACVNQLDSLCTIAGGGYWDGFCVSSAGNQDFLNGCDIGAAGIASIPTALSCGGGGGGAGGVCGDTILDGGEQCDDGNLTNGDGCDEFCFVELSDNGCSGAGPNGTCEEGEDFMICMSDCPVPDDSNCDGGAPDFACSAFEDALTCASDCWGVDPSSSQCGNGIIEGDEDCDDGNISSGDGCTDACLDENTEIFPYNPCFEHPVASNGLNYTLEGYSSGHQSDISCTVALDGECGSTKWDSTCVDLFKNSCFGACSGAIYCVVDNICDQGFFPENNSTCSQDCYCGDGVCDATYENATSCAVDCSGGGGGATCGDGILEGAEECDDGNAINGDGCDQLCLLEPANNCGNSVVDSGEDCDDGADGDDYDGCTDSCTSAAICGDGLLDLSEQCEDSNRDNGDGCDSSCFSEVCGDLQLHPTLEECDDGNLVNGDGCSASCTTETGPVCGNGLLEGAESCDDGNLFNGDGCDSSCLVELVSDGTPPTVTSFVPANGSTGLFPDAFLAVNFSEAMDISSLTTDNVYLQATADNTLNTSGTGTNLCTSISTNSEFTQAICEFLDFGSALTPNTCYELTANASVADSSTEQKGTFDSTKFCVGGDSLSENPLLPTIRATFPRNEEQDIAINTDVFVYFRIDTFGNMEDTAEDADAVTNPNNVGIYTVDQNDNLVTNVCASGGCSYNFSGIGGNVLQITPTSNLTANTRYALRVSSVVSNDLSIVSRESEEQTLGEDKTVFFNTNGGTDTTAPTIVSVSPTSLANDVEQNLSSVLVEASEHLDPIMLLVDSLFCKDDNGDFQCDGVNDTLYNITNSPAVTASGTLRLNPNQNSAVLGLADPILEAGETYCFDIGAIGLITDSAGNAMARTQSCFTAASSYTPTQPNLEFVEVIDGNEIVIQYDQPICIYDANTFVYEGGSFDKLSITADNVPVDLFLATIQYDVANYQHRIRDVRFLNDGVQIAVTASGLRDMSCTSDAGGGTFTSEEIGTFDPENHDFDTEINHITNEFNPVFLNPFSPLGGQTTDIEFEFPAASLDNFDPSNPGSFNAGNASTIGTGYKAVITFPDGFGLSNVTLGSHVPGSATDLSWGPGVTSASVAVNSGAGRVTLTFTQTGETLFAFDQIMGLLKDVRLPVEAGEYATSIKVYNASGTLVATHIPRKINVVGGGDLTISGTVCSNSVFGGTCDAEDTAISGMKMVARPLATFAVAGTDVHDLGVLETTTDSNGDYSFEVFPGFYEIQPLIDFSKNNVAGAALFQHVPVEESSASDVDFKFIALSGTNAKTLTINVSGAPANEDMEAVCHNPEFGEVFKKFTTNGSGVGSVELTMRSDEEYMCRIDYFFGDRDDLSSGTLIQSVNANFVPPRVERVKMDTDKTLNFGITKAEKTITGSVSCSGTGKSGVGVNIQPEGAAFTSTGEFAENHNGAFGITDGEGNFSINVGYDGVYFVRACKGTCSERIIEVKGNNVFENGTLLNSGVTFEEEVGCSGVSYGVQVLDEAGNGIEYAGVFCEKWSGASCTDGFPLGGESFEKADSNGNATVLLSGAGTYRCEAFGGTYDVVGCKVATVPSSGLTGQTIQASSEDFGTLNITLTKSSSPVAAKVDCFGPAGQNHGTTAAADGTLAMKLRTGTYTCEVFGSTGIGAREEGISVTAGGTTSKAISLSSGGEGTLAIDSGSLTDVFCDVHATNGSGTGNFGEVDSSGELSMTLPVGNYHLGCYSPTAFRQVCDQDVAITADQTVSVDCNGVSGLVTVTADVEDDEGTGVSAEFLFTKIDDSGNPDVTRPVDTDADGDLSQQVPAGTYDIFVVKDGYESPALARFTVTENPTNLGTFVLTQNDVSITAAVKDSVGDTYGGTAWVFAEKSDNPPIIKETTTGSASVNVSNGTYTVRAECDDGKQAGGTTVTVTDGVASPSSVTLTCSATNSDWVTGSATKSFDPTDGGNFKFDDLGEYFAVIIPQNTLSSSDENSATAKIQYKPSLKFNTPSTIAIGNPIDISFTNASGASLRSAEGSTIKIPVATADIPAGYSCEDMFIIKVVGGKHEPISTTHQVLDPPVDGISCVLIGQADSFSTYGAGAGNGGGNSGGGNGGGGDNGGGGGGGGAAGGSSSGPNPPQPASTPTAATAQQTVFASFELEQPAQVTIGASNHTITLFSADAEKAIVSIQSDPNIGEYTKNTVKNVDTDNNTIDDLRVTYLGEVEGKYRFSFINLVDEGEKENPMTLNYGQYETDNQNVILSFNVTNTNFLAISNDDDFGDNSFEAFDAENPQVQWKLTDGDGLKTVYVKFRSPEGGVLTTSDTITLTGQGFEQVVIEVEPEPEPIAVADCPLEIGKPYTHGESTAVYYITETCTKRAFQNSRTYFTYYASWADVHVTTAEIMNRIPDDAITFMPLGPRYKLDSGSLVKAVTSPKVFFILGSTKYWVNSETFFGSLKFLWSWIQDVSDELLDQYDEGTPITNDRRPDGSVFKYDGQPEVYKLEDGQKRHIKNVEILKELYRTDRIPVAPITEQYRDGAPIE